MVKNNLAEILKNRFQKTIEEATNEEVATAAKRVLDKLHTVNKENLQLLTTTIKNNMQEGMESLKKQQIKQMESMGMSSEQIQTQLSTQNSNSASSEFDISNMSEDMKNILFKEIEIDETKIPIEDQYTFLKAMGYEIGNSIGELDRIDIAKETIEKAQNNLLKIQQQERQPLIDNTIMELFLLKKALYVKYMANQKILQDRHSGNTKEQRVFAKSYIDEIPFISYYTLWNL